jgi:PAS domain S-box-containing protein
MDEPQLATLVGRLAIDCPDAVIYADRDGKIRFWNRAAVRIFGFAENEALGQTLDLIVPEGLRARHWEGYDRVMAGAASRYGEGDLLSVPALRKDGSRISVEFTILPVRDETGAMAGIAAFLRDVTPRFAEMRSLRRELAELKAQIRPGPP